VKLVDGFLVILNISPVDINLARSEFDQLESRHGFPDFAVAERAFQVPAGDTRVFTGDALGTRTFTSGDGLDNATVMVDGDEKELVGFRGDVVAPEESARRGEGMGTDLFHCSSEEAAVGKAEHFRMESRIQINVLGDVFQRQLPSPYQLNHLLI